MWFCQVGISIVSSLSLVTASEQDSDRQRVSHFRVALLLLWAEWHLNAGVVLL